MTEQHTPGPWEVGSTGIITAKSATTFICDTRKSAKRFLPPNAEIDANARLIAAAPELLEALESIANNRLSVDVPNDEIDKHDYAQGWDELVKIARAAIAKAKGVQP